ncbi:multidrug effflux MFS transporter [Calothrix sp. PCC 7507]|uniref:multidrug effflux MFS transporter n=1 Tax=Calothrix sp. PCC 7507 TaxID=99598 RepID=UPI0005AAEB4B|nr:multidrug effflux MFS transporter [Calothrix sp. PCC 7507]
MRIRPKSLGFTIFLGMLAALPPLSIDMGLPAFPTISASLNASSGSVGLTLSLFMAGFAIAQLIFGPLSDRYGRKPILLIGCGLFALAGAACAVAPSINTLIAWRLVQGAGAGAGMVLTLATVRDLFDGAAARAQLSYVNLVMSVAPMIAPTIGGWVLVLANWRAIYGVLALAGFLLLLTVAFGLSESLAHPDLTALQPHRLFKNYTRILSNPICLGYALVNALNFGCMFAYVAGSPLVMLQVFGVSTTTYGWLFASTAFGIMVGSFLNGRLSLRGVLPSRLLIVGLVTATISAVALVIVSVSGIAQVSTLMPLLILNTFCRGIISPNAMHGAIQPVPESAGVAAAVVGFLQMLGGAVASGLVAFLYDGKTAIAMSSLMAIFAIASLAAYTVLARPAEHRLQLSK